LVDGVDSELLSQVMASGNYNSTYDFNRDGVINAADVQILGSNYGFTANRAPVVSSTSVLTHSDGMIRTQSPPWGGVRGGEYMVGIDQDINLPTGSVKLVKGKLTVTYNIAIAVSRSDWLSL